jgi:hypothetical protein
MPAYLVAGLCGEGTAYTCPDPAFPLAKRSAPTNITIPSEELAGRLGAANAVIKQ